MFDWLSDIFNEDTFKTIVNGANTAGSIFNQLSPIINAGSQLALGIEGTGNAKAFNEANAAAQARLDSLFSPTGDYAQELRNQLERKDAAAGRRSQYGTRETELMSKLAKEKASVLTSPAYANFLRNQFISPYAPIAGAVGNLTGGTTGAGQPGVQGQQGRSGAPIPPGLSEAGQYLFNLFGPGAEASIASLGGAGSALAGAGTPAALGVVDSLGSMLGGSPFLPGYSSGATGIFGPALGGAAEAAGSTAGGSTLGDAADAGLGLVGGLGDVIGAGLGGAGSALSGMGAGSLAGTVGGLDSLGALAGGTGFLPGYAGTGATGIFGGGVGTGAAGAASGAGSAGGGAAGGLGGFGAAAGAALPIAVLLGGLAQMFQQGTQPIDLSQSWQANAGGLNQGNFNQFTASDPTLNALVGLSTENGQFNYDKYNEALQKATVGGKNFTGDALAQAQQFGQTVAQNPGWMGGPAATGPAGWWDPYAQGTPSN